LALVGGGFALAVDLEMDRVMAVTMTAPGVLTAIRSA
jgi:hypothetical protein